MTDFAKGEFDSGLLEDVVMAFYYFLLQSPEGQETLKRIHWNELSISVQKSLKEQALPCRIHDLRAAISSIRRLEESLKREQRLPEEPMSRSHYQFNFDFAISSIQDVLYSLDPSDEEAKKRYPDPVYNNEEENQPIGSDPGGPNQTMQTLDP